jgi:hypothetical protein
MLRPGLISDILAEVGNTPDYHPGIYGDWTTVNMAGWKKVLHENAIHLFSNFVTPSVKMLRTAP